MRVNARRVGIYCRISDVNLNYAIRDLACLTALIIGLVGSGLITGLQGDTLTGLINAAVTAAAAFGHVLATEPKGTPTADPCDNHGHPLTPTEPPVVEPKR